MTFPMTLYLKLYTLLVGNQYSLKRNFKYVFSQENVNLCTPQMCLGYCKFIVSSLVCIVIEFYSDK